jgi:hypothetical protein
MSRLVLGALLACGCTAIDDFGKFKFVDGGDGGADGSAGDLAATATGNFGQPCNQGFTCNAGPTGAPLDCNRDLPGTMCTRACDHLTSPLCVDFGAGKADCVPTPDGDLCLPTCFTVENNFPCRDSNYICCGANNMPKPNGPGVCGPTTGMCH